MIKSTKAQTANVLSHDGESIVIEGIVASVGVIDGIKITPQVLKSSLRWLNGRPIKLGERKIGQIDECSLLNGQQISIKASLWGLKLSQSELYSFKPGEQNIQHQGAFWPITKPADGVLDGESFKEEAVSMEWDHIHLTDSEQIKGHAAEGQWEKLEKIDKAWDHALGRA